MESETALPLIHHLGYHECDDNLFGSQSQYMMWVTLDDSAIFASSPRLQYMEKTHSHDKMSHLKVFEILNTQLGYIHKHWNAALKI